MGEGWGWGGGGGGILVDPDKQNKKLGLRDFKTCSRHAIFFFWLTESFIVFILVLSIYIFTFYQYRFCHVMYSNLPDNVTL